MRNVTDVLRSTIAGAARFRKALGMLALIGLGACAASDAATPLPNPKVDMPLAATKGPQTAVFAGGCFWGIEAVFEHLKGVLDVTSGYAGGTAETADYRLVSSGSTAHAEAVQVTYDPSKITYGQLLKVFFSVAHNPTELNRQGPDSGPQYRSAIFHSGEEQKRVASAYIAQLGAAKVFSRPIVTQVVPLQKYYLGEAYHQDYAAKHPYEPYIMIHDLPKVAALQKQFPELYVAK